MQISSFGFDVRLWWAALRAEKPVASQTMNEWMNEWMDKFIYSLPHNTRHNYTDDWLLRSWGADAAEAGWDGAVSMVTTPLISCNTARQIFAKFLDCCAV